MQHNLAFERSVLSTLIYKPESIAEALKEGLTADDFHLAFHQKVFRVIDELNRDGFVEEGMIAASLGSEMDERLMIDILTANPIANVIPYVRELISLAALTRMRTGAAKLVAMIDEGASYGDALDYMHRNGEIESRGGGLKIRRLSEIEGKDAEFIGKSFLPFPKNSVSMIVAGGGVGKTFLLIQTAMRIIDEDRLKVFMWLTEDRLEICKKRVEIISERILLNGYNRYENYLYIAGSDSEPAHFLEETKEGMKVSSAFYRFQKLMEDFDVIIIDPLIGVFGGDENSNPQAKQFISLFTSWAANAGKTILFIHHATKGTSTQRGASAFADAVRMIYQVEIPKPKEGQAPFEDGKRNIVIAKDNYGAQKILGGATVLRQVFPAAEVKMPKVLWQN